MAFRIEEFKGNMPMGGARANLFEVRLSNPVNPEGDQFIPFRCRAASLPARNVNPIQVSYFGRSVKFPGVVQNYDDWNITILEDEDFKVRNALEEWSHAINSPIGNKRERTESSMSLIKGTADIISMSQRGDKLRHYKMVGIWPVSIAEITTDWSNEAVVEYQVTFSLDYWTPGDEGSTGLAGGTGL